MYVAEGECETDAEGSQFRGDDEMKSWRWEKQQEEVRRSQERNIHSDMGVKRQNWDQDAQSTRKVNKENNTRGNE